MGKFKILGNFLHFLAKRKKWWLIPLVIFLVLLSMLFIFSSGSVLSPFIYTLF